MKSLLKLISLTVILSGAAIAQDTDTLDFTTKLQKVDPAKNILSDENALVWGGSPIIGEDGKYHLFYATWGNKMQGPFKNDNTFFGMRCWVKYSVIDHAVSDKPLLSPDNKQTFHRVVNPSVERGHDGKYYMMFKTAAKKTGGGYLHRIAQSKSPDGPFTVAGKVLEDGRYRAEDPYFWYDAKRKRYYAIVKNFVGENSALSQNALASSPPSTPPKTGNPPSTTSSHSANTTP